ncbi:MAG: hypothetical protein NUV87_00905 [Candidatus Roizmanbacteria bacterium]|nr:hypothetical protein [Candidatus Roizmanbacteria bacterium]MCR4313414.1 hypothetical protein [Candidatus Roizmanbacteria bacterium]
MITDADIKKIKKALTKTFLTKEDAKNFATKDDLKSFLTKEDGKRFATKDDLKNYATRDDLVSFKDSILSEIIKLREDIEVVIGYRDMIENHDQRIEKLETTVYQ